MINYTDSKFWDFNRDCKDLANAIPFFRMLKLTEKSQGAFIIVENWKGKALIKLLVKYNKSESMIYKIAGNDALMFIIFSIQLTVP